MPRAIIVYQENGESISHSELQYVVQYITLLHRRLCCFHAPPSFSEPQRRKTILKRGKEENRGLRQSAGMDHIILVIHLPNSTPYCWLKYCMLTRWNISHTRPTNYLTPHVRSIAHETWMLIVSVQNFFFLTQIVREAKMLREVPLFTLPANLKE